MAAPTQKGTGLLVKAAPTFTNFICDADSWKETDVAVDTETKNEESEVINIATADPGIDATGDLYPKTGVTPLVKGDLLVSTESPTRRFVVREVENSGFGGKVRKQTVKLSFRTKLDSVITT